MKRIAFIILFLSNIFIIPLVFADPEINVRDITKSIGYGQYGRFITVQSQEDGLIIKNMNVNRGKCNKVYFNGQKASTLPNKPVKLDYGDTYSFQIDDKCSILEIEIETNKGTAYYK